MNLTEKLSTDLVEYLEEVSLDVVSPMSIDIMRNTGMTLRLSKLDPYEDSIRDVMFPIELDIRNFLER